MRICVLVLGLLTGGCAFDGNGQAGAGDPEDPGVPDASTATATDASLAAPVDAAPPADAAASSRLLETLAVPATGAVVTSRTELAPGTTYVLVARGTFVADDLDDIDADAEYFWFRDLPRVIADATLTVDIGLAVDDRSIDGTRQPQWGAFAADAIYQVEFEAPGGPIEAQIHDVNYRDNQGALTLEIYGP